MNRVHLLSHVRRRPEGLQLDAALPVFMVEANYEFENNDRRARPDFTLRRQEYWTMLSGATGQLYGNGYTWGLYEDLERALRHQGRDRAGLLGKSPGDRPWQALAPDQRHQFLVDGAGKPSSDGDVLDNDYATAAVTPDGTFGAVYVPTNGRSRSIRRS